MDLLTSAQVAGLVILGVGLTFPLMAWYVWSERGRAVVSWFLGALIGAAGWSVVNGLARLVSDGWATELLVALGYVFAGLGVVCWVLVIFVYVTGATRLARWLFPLLLVPPVVEQVLFWNTTTRDLVHAPGSSVDQAGVFLVEPGPAYIAVAGYYLLVILFGLGMLVPTWVRSEWSRRHQTGLLVLATLAFIGGGGLALVDIWGPYHPFMLMFPAATGILAHALVRYRLFEITPVGRQTTVRQMDDAVIILDDSGIVTDINPAARLLLGLEDGAVGAKVETLVDEIPALIDILDREPPVREELTNNVEGGTTRHFDVQVTDLAAAEDQQGVVVVLRDITELKHREQELDLLKQVYARVFRHNIRNEMSVLKGYAELTREEGDGPLEQYSDEILESAEQIVEHSEKAQVIEDVVDVDHLESFDLASLLEGIAAEATSEHPAADITIDVPRSLTVRAHPEFEAALRELLDNAIVHAPDGDNPQIEVHAVTEGEEVVLVIADESGGLDTHEIETLQAGAEEPLKHGSGVGLWLIRFVVDRSRGDLTLENTGNGTRAQLRLQAD